MNDQFAESLRKLREARGLSQKQLGEQIFTTQSTVARWENGRYLPDAGMVFRIAKCFGVDAQMLYRLAAQSEEILNVIMVDDNQVILTGGLPILEAVLPDATITGFTSPLEAIEYAMANPVALAFLDIEMGKMSGLELCRKLLEINPRTNIVYLTAFIDYSLDAWKTGASGFMLKPLTPEGVKDQLKRLRHPFPMGGSDT